MKYDKLMKNKSLEVESQAFIYKEELTVIKDELYLDFLKRYNGGYFYNNSLLLFGFSDKKEQFNIIHINSVFKKCYSSLVENSYFFGQDIFGNPFAFEKGKVVFFNLESGKKEILANDFKEWLDMLYNNLDYYTGESLVYELDNIQKQQLALDKRLCPKYPFILGGEYNINNLVLKGYVENISYNADIAKQVHNLPEGSKIKIVIKDE